MIDLPRTFQRVIEEKIDYYQNFQINDFCSLTCEYCNMQCNIIGVVRGKPEILELSKDFPPGKFYYRMLKDLNYSDGAICDLVKKNFYPEILILGYINFVPVHGLKKDCYIGERKKFPIVLGAKSELVKV